MIVILIIELIVILMFFNTLASINNNHIFSSSHFMFERRFEDMSSNKKIEIQFVYIEIDKLKFFPSRVHSNNVNK